MFEAQKVLFEMTTENVCFYQYKRPFSTNRYETLLLLLPNF